MLFVSCIWGYIFLSKDLTMKIVMVEKSFKYQLYKFLFYKSNEFPNFNHGFRYT